MGSDGDTKGTAVTECRAVRAELVEVGKAKSYRSSHGNIRLWLVLCGKRKVIKTPRKSKHKSAFGFKVTSSAETGATDRGDERIQLGGM